jgi:hypothetical protein
MTTLPVICHSKGSDIPMGSAAIYLAGDRDVPHGLFDEPVDRAQAKATSTGITMCKISIAVAERRESVVG